MTPRIAYLTSQYPGPSHTFILREVLAVRARGVAVDTFSVRVPSEDELADPAMAAEARTTFNILSQSLSTVAVAHLKLLTASPARYARGFAKALRHRPPGLRGLTLAVAHFAEAGVLAVELRRREVTHLHNHFANSAATVGFLAAGMIDLPWSFMIHGISESDYPAGITLPAKIRAARFVACASWFGRAQAMRVVEPEYWPKVQVVRCGLPVDQVARSAPDRSGRKVICVGRLSPEKGQSGLLDTFVSVRNRIADAQLILVGNGPDEQILRDQTDRRDLGDAVQFMGRLSETDTLDAIAASDVLVVSSFMEGLPIVLMEAMALGTAVIAPRLAGIPELVEDGCNGLLFTPSDWNELGQQIERLLGDSELRARLANHARQTIVSDFDIARSASALESLFSTEATPAAIR